MNPRISRFFTVIFLWPVYLLSYIFPRSKHVWVYGSFNNTFADNSKYLFLQQHHCKNDRSPVMPVWITKNEMLAAKMRKDGYRSYRKVSVMGIYYCLRASVYVYSWTVRDINFWLSGGARYINLWHGLPFKKIGTDNQSDKEKRNNKPKRKSLGKSLLPFLRPSVFLKADLFLSTFSPEVSTIFRRTFPAKQLIHALYPRVEHFIMAETDQNNFIETVATSEEKKLISYLKPFDSVWIYMPTFRDSKEDKNKMYEQEVFDFDKINPILQRRNILLLVKYHYVAMQLITDTEKYSNILFINSKTDVYVVLPFTSGLITDYSSIFFDYMLLNKPMLFYNFDIDSYQANSRAFYYPYNEATCGTKIKTFPEVCQWFDSGAYNQTTFNYKPYIDRFWGVGNEPFLLKQLIDRYK